MYDVIIIGAGVVGCAAARELGRYRLRTLVLERESDAACGASKANSGIVHAGYDCQPGTLKAALNIQGAELYKTLVTELDIPYRNNGSLVLCMHEADMPKLRALYDSGIANGVSGLSIISGEETLRLEPSLNPHVHAALLAETAGVISPYEATVAFAENAIANGADFRLETEVTGISYDGKSYTVVTGNGTFNTRTVVNAAGADSARIHNFVCARREAVDLQRGQYYLLDNTQRGLVSRTIFQLPTPLGKGVLVAPTVDYNTLLGPTAEDMDVMDTQTTREGLDEAVAKARITLANVPLGDRITAFAGVRAKHASKDFIIEETFPGFVDVMGIDSPGLSAAPAIALRVAALVADRLQPRLNTAFISRREGIKRFKSMSFEEQARRVAENPAYGHVVCRCETVTEAEIVAAVRRPLGARNLDAVKRRTRAQMGRCQGGFCTLKLTEILSRELGVPEWEITKNGGASWI